MSCSQIAPKLLGSEIWKLASVNRSFALHEILPMTSSTFSRKSGESYRSDLSRRLPFVTAERWYMQSASALSFRKQPHAWSNNSIRFLLGIALQKNATLQLLLPSQKKKNNQNKTNANTKIFEKKKSTRQYKTYKEALMTMNNEVEAARVSSEPPTFTA